jgi:hypothetical protein
MRRAQSDSLNQAVAEPRPLRGLFFEAVRNVTVLQKIEDYSKATTVPTINERKINQVGAEKGKKVSAANDIECPAQ